jgi:transposase-like protein
LKTGKKKRYNHFWISPKIQKEGYTMQELYLNDRDLPRRMEEWQRISWQLIEAESVNFKQWMANRFIEQKFTESIGARRYERTKKREGYRDGHYPRYLQLKSCRVKLRIPRSTGKKWLNPLVQKFRRRSEEFEQMVYDGFIYGMSCRDSRKNWQHYFGEDVISGQGVSDIFRKLSREVKRWHERPIVGKYRYLFWDGKFVRIRGVRKRKKVVLKVMGIRFDGTCELLDFRVARSESYLAWSELAQSLQNRGLDCQDTELFVHDGADGLIETLTLLWPDVERQQCKVHHMRNLGKRVKRKNKGKILKDAAKIYKAKSLEQAESRANKFESKWKDKEGEGVRIFMKDIGPTLTFYKFGWDKGFTKEDRQALWRVISNTNILERNIEEDVRRIKTMRSFRNDESCDRVFYAIAKESNENPWRLPVLAQKPISARILT